MMQDYFFPKDLGNCEYIFLQKHFVFCFFFQREAEEKG